MALDAGTVEAHVRISYDDRELKSFHGDMRSAQRGAGQLEKSSKGLGSSLKGHLARGAKYAGAAMAGGLVIGMKKSVEASSDLEEAVNKNKEVFEGSSKAMLDWSKDSATAMGLSKQAALEGSASIGAMLKPMGIAPSKAAEMSREMTQLAADMASFNNEDPTEMLDRIRAGLSGESEPLKRFGSVLSETRIAEYAYAEGLAKTGEKLTERQKIQARYGLLLKDTADQQGDFGRTSEGLANRMRTLQAQFENLAATAGETLVPILEKLAGWASEKAMPAFEKFFKEFNEGTGAGGRVREVLDQVLNTLKNLWPVIRGTGVVVGQVAVAFTKLPGPIQQALFVLGGVAVAVNKFGALIPVLVKVGKAAKAFFLLMRAAPAMMGPMGLLLTGLAAAVYLLIKNWDKAKVGFKMMANAVAAAAKWLLEGLKKVFNWIAGAAKSAFELVKKAAKVGLLGPIPLIISHWDKIVGFFKSLPGKIGSALKSVGKIVLKPFTWAVGQIKSALDSVVGWFKGAVSDIKSAVDDVTGFLDPFGGGGPNLTDFFRRGGKPGVQAFSKGGKVGPGHGGPRLLVSSNGTPFIAGEGRKEEAVLSYEGPRDKNRALAFEFLEKTGGIQAFAKGGKVEKRRERHANRTDRARATYDLRARAFELSGGFTSAREYTRLLRQQEQIRKRLRSQIKVNKGEERRRLLMELKQARLDSKELRKTRNEALQEQKIANTTRTRGEFRLGGLRTDLQLAEAGYGGDAGAIRDQLKAALEERLAKLRKRMAKPGQTRKQIEALREAIGSTLSELGGLTSSQGPSIVEQIAAGAAAREALFREIGGNARQMGGTQLAAGAGGTTVVLQGEFKLDDRDPNVGVRKLAHQLANQL